MLFARDRTKKAVMASAGGLLLLAGSGATLIGRPEYRLSADPRLLESPEPEQLDEQESLAEGNHVRTMQDLSSSNSGEGASEEPVEADVRAEAPFETDEPTFVAADEPESFDDTGL